MVDDGSLCNRLLFFVLLFYSQSTNAVGDLEGAEPFPLGDGLTPSVTVMLANAKF